MSSIRWAEQAKFLLGNSGVIDASIRMRRTRNQYDQQTCGTAQSPVLAVFPPTYNWLNYDYLNNVTLKFHEPFALLVDSISRLYGLQVPVCSHYTNFNRERMYLKNGSINV